VCACVHVCICVVCMHFCVRVVLFGGLVWFPCCLCMYKHDNQTMHVTKSCLCMYKHDNQTMHVTKSCLCMYKHDNQTKVKSPYIVMLI
jgi:hypothetical protein